MANQRFLPRPTCTFHRLARGEFHDWTNPQDLLWLADSFSHHLEPPALAPITLKCEGKFRLFHFSCMAKEGRNSSSTGPAGEAENKAITPVNFPI